MKIPVGIVTTERRADYLDRQLAHLGDPAPIVYKDLAPGLTPNHRAAWRELFKLHHRALLLQDDAWPALNWREAIDLICDRFPTAPVINLFSARAITRTEEAKRDGYAQGPGFNLMYDLALIVQRDVYADFDAWVDRKEYEPYTKGEPEKWAKHHDSLLRLYMRDRKIPELLTAPPVFQHVGKESTVGHSWVMFGRERSSPDWPGEGFDVAAHFRRLWQ